MKASQLRAIHAKRKGGFDTGYYIEYKKELKNGGLGKMHHTKNFNTIQKAITQAKKFQTGNTVVNIIDGRNVIAHKKIGAINLSGKFSEGV